ncbi:unnamed protein product, partial [Mesorhabditis belari]|uniref:Tyrosine--tRNA ligase n=1 Tax=Mesorhabditis belari TaxID=2138241 RepID=A0AAF3J8F8_9BILA
MAEKAAAKGVELTETDQARYDLIIRNLQEVLGGEKLKDQLARGKNVHVYWGTATTGKPHVGYLVPMRKIADMLQAGLKVTILFADLHAFLDNMKSTWELLENRVIYYENVIKALLQSLDVPIEQLHFIRGTTYQLSKNYTYDILRLCAKISQRDALRAGAEVVKQVESPFLSGLLYPLLQALDEQYLKVDGQFGGVDQRKIFILAEEQLPNSEENSKIDLLDEPQIVQRKIEGAMCEIGAEDNGVLAFYQYVLFPIVLPNPVNVNGKSYGSFDELKGAFINGLLTGATLKEGLHKFLNELLAKVQNRCDTPEIKDAIRKGYQDVPEQKVSLSPTSIQLSESEKKAFDQIVNGLSIVGSEHSLKRSLQSNEPLKVSIPIFCKGRFHLGYLMPLLLIKKYLASGVNIQASILLIDMIGFLDNEKIPWAARDGRAAYFAVALKQVIQLLGLEDKVQVCRSADDENNNFSKDYVLEMYKMASIVTRDETSISEGTMLSGNLIPLIYALDVHYSNADVVLLGENNKDQIATLAEKLWNKSIGVNGPTQLIYPCLIGMNEAKMSATVLDAQLDPLDTAKQLKKKIAGSFCEPQNVKRNVALTLAQQLVFPLLDGEPLEISRSEENGGNISIENFDQLVKEFEVGSNPQFPLHPADLKTAVVNVINKLCEPLRSSIPQNVVTAAFPKNK